MSLRESTSDNLSKRLPSEYADKALLWAMVR